MKKNTVIFKNARFTFYSDCSFKAEYSTDGKFIDKDLFVTEINNITPGAPAASINGDTINIKTKKLLLKYICKNNGFDGKNLQVFYKIKNKTGKWYYGKKDTKNLGGSMLHLFMFPKCTKPGHLLDGVLSRNGYYVYYDNTYTFRDKNCDWAELEYKKGYSIFFFIGYGDDFRTGLNEFSKIFGKCPLVPMWALGYWYSRWHPYTQDEFVGIVKKYRSAGIPIDVMVVDTDWRKEGWKGYEFSEKYFYDFQKFTGEMKNMGIKLTLNDHPGYNSSEILPESDENHKRISEHLNRKITGDWRCNWAVKSDVEAFSEVLIKPKIRMGVDFWWVDGWGADGLVRNEEFFKKHIGADKMSLGTKGYERIDPQLWLNHFYYKSTKEVSKKRGLILSRWGGIGAHRYPVEFSGDTYSTWRTLAYEVFFTYTGGNMLANYWSHDIGGFLGAAISKELFIRWFQFGAFSPVMRTHSTKGGCLREPWDFDDETVKIFRKYVRIRYRLIPYFYTHAFCSYEKAVPWLRAMYHNYPDDKESYRFKYQYMLGDDILIAPVVEKKSSSSGKKVFFPGGNWIDVENGVAYKGKTVKKIDTVLENIPFFVREGAVIPVAQDEQYVGEKKNNVLRFEIFLADINNSCNFFEYYEDDGLTDDYQKKKYIKIKISVKKERGAITVQAGRMEGSYKNLTKQRRLEIILHSAKDIKITGANATASRENKIFGEIDSKFNSVRIAVDYNGALGAKIKFNIR